MPTLISSLDGALATKDRETQQSNSATSTAENSSGDEQPNGIASLIALAERFATEMTQEELAQLPTDGAEQHDHYIYNTSKDLHETID